MEAQIQYARTDDGVSLAYATVGDGPPVLYCPTHFLSMKHLLSDTTPSTAAFLRQLACTRITIFDHAGIGASQREVGDFSLGAQLREIEAIAARLAGDSFTLVGFGAGSAVAALYAARHSDRVRELACLYPAPSIVTERLAGTMREDWSLARRRLASWAYPESIATQRWFSNGMRESVPPEVAAAYCEEFARTDLREIYRRIPVRTLFCVTAEGQDREDALALAGLVPDCRVATVAADAIAGVAAAVLEFMGVDPAQVSPPPAASSAAHGTAIILFTDIVDSTGLTERMGDAAFRERSAGLDVAMRRAITAAGGAAHAAIAAALRCNAAAAAAGLELHLGIHAGDVIRDGGNVYGGAVNIAARISGLSAPGEILVSDIVRGLARTSAGVVFEDRGEHALKGIADAVRVYAVKLSVDS